MIARSFQARWCRYRSPTARRGTGGAGQDLRLRLSAAATPQPQCRELTSGRTSTGFIQPNTRSQAAQPTRPTPFGLKPKKGCGNTKFLRSAIARGPYHLQCGFRTVNLDTRIRHQFFRVSKEKVPKTAKTSPPRAPAPAADSEPQSCIEKNAN